MTDSPTHLRRWHSLCPHRDTGVMFSGVRRTLVPRIFPENMNLLCIFDPETCSVLPVLNSGYIRDNVTTMDSARDSLASGITRKTTLIAPKRGPITITASHFSRRALTRSTRSPEDGAT